MAVMLQTRTPCSWRHGDTYSEAEGDHRSRGHRRRMAAHQHVPREHAAAGKLAGGIQAATAWVVAATSR
eukprot:1776330-Alexandrium_andersonii.AAC.1